MPTIEVSHRDLCKLIGKSINADELHDVLLYAKCELDSVLGDTLKIDIKDTNRPELWSVEGIAREIRLRYKQDFPDYKIGKSDVIVTVDKDMASVRPFTVCAVARNLKINDNVLSQIIQLQEKIAGTFGRNRKEVAIGVYDLKKIRSPIRFMPVRPDGIRFVPLDFEKEMTPKEILERHPKGKEYAHLLKGMSRYPIFIDADNNVLSMPPIINSNMTGKVTKNTTDLFIECSGFDMKFLTPALNAITAAFLERGATLETVTVNYSGKSVTTPDMTPKEFSVNLQYLNSISGLDLNRQQATRLLNMSGYRVSGAGNDLKLKYPAYRQDIMHPRDVAEDVIISYGINSIEPELPLLHTKGKVSASEIKNRKAAEILIGCGLQEILSYTLTNKADLFDKMDTHDVCAEIDNPQSANWSVFRTWLLPGMLDFLSRNKHVEYPQKIFEIGNCILVDEKQETKTRDITKASVAITNSLVSYEDISSVLDIFMKSRKMHYTLKKYDHPSFIPGRSAEIIAGNRHIGFIGEIHPKILNNWKIEKPVVALEIEV